MNSIEKLTEIFSHFPGIGQRQARRFVYYLLTRNNSTIEELIKNISELKKDTAMCVDCKRFFEKKFAGQNLCKICSDENRDYSILMIVPRDIDLDSVEKNSVFNGYYFVLGGTVPILEKEPSKKVRVQDLLMFVEKKLDKNKEKNLKLKEIILAVSVNPEGENTANFIKESLKALTDKFEIKVSTLGKGLSTGTELEYTDPDTLKNAFKNRA